MIDNLPPVVSVPLTPIGIVRSCFKEKFGTPRQPGLVPEASAVIELFPEFSPETAIVGLDGISHIWVMFYFHRTADQGWRPMVRPPRLGGNRKLGIYATRSMFRPNPIGLSVVRLKKIETRPVRFYITGGDLVDGSPVFDIKPYLPYADALPDAMNRVAPAEPRDSLSVIFSDAADILLESLPSEQSIHLRTLIEQVIGADPRPAYRQAHPDDRTYGMQLEDFEVRWRVFSDQADVFEIRKLI